MDFVTAVKTCLAQKYAEFNGRASRPEFWWFALFSFVVQMIARMLLGVSLGGLVALALLVPSLAVGSRRLHDIGKSGWFQLLAFIPVIGWLVLLYWYVQPGKPEANQYGDAVKDAPPPPPEMAPE
jgi:uncharacterized membrane protein YhaH (DUF805 family)